MFFLLSFSMVSQELTTKEISKIRSLEIDVMKLNKKDIYTQVDLHTILRVDKKRRVNKTWAIVLSSISFFILIDGIILKKSNDLPAVTSLLGDLAIVGSILYGGASIPFWIATNKHKKERDRLLLKYQ